MRAAPDRRRPSPPRPATARRRPRGRRPRLGPRRRAVPVRRLRLRPARGPQPPVHPRPLLHGHGSARRPPRACASGSRARAPKISGATRRARRAAAGCGCATTAATAFTRSAPDRGASSTRRRAAPARGCGRRCAVTGGANTAARRGGERGAQRHLPRPMVLSRDGGARARGQQRRARALPVRRRAAEMPASWPAEALKAQAVVARSYALRSRRPSEPYDVFADVRSQVYRGVAGRDRRHQRRRARHARARRDGRRRDRPDVLLLHLGRAHRRQRGGVRRLPISVPAPRSTTRYDDLSPVPHVDAPASPTARRSASWATVAARRAADLRSRPRTPTGRAATVGRAAAAAIRRLGGHDPRACWSCAAHWFTIRRDPARPPLTGFEPGRGSESRWTDRRFVRYRCRTRWPQAACTSREPSPQPRVIGGWSARPVAIAMTNDPARHASGRSLS